MGLQAEGAVEANNWVAAEEQQQQQYTFQL
ncbi:unnamed protein product [Linum tenue]|uniref:Uncharacterized protein n=1 Tax=Linum tenue TaxID=586396 RepID=A0AAV0LBK7_9ROSI|nr:unnamed protein product [Linum tenue]